jgi:nitrite reductase/ring-hydroxylating ferredoxin subunit/uncharacterized membrane protein
MRPLLRDAVERTVERLEVLDPIGENLQGAVKALVPQESQLKDLLSGTWLGHPLHPLLTDVVIGSWTSAFLLDALGGEAGENAADRLIGLGCLAALPTAAAGFSDWAELWGPQRRIGEVHAAGNITALGLFGTSWLARKAGLRTAGKLLSLLALGVSVTSAWLGGHLSFGKGVGVNQTAFEEWPTDWTPVADDGDLDTGKPVSAKANGVDVFLVRQNGQVHAMLNRCTHRGCGLSDGQFDGETITCPCHGSTFALDGSLVKGPATAPQTSLEARVREGKVEVRRTA